jgi:signal transduction histidine kinase
VRLVVIFLFLFLAIGCKESQGGNVAIATQSSSDGTNSNTSDNRERLAEKAKILEQTLKESNSLQNRQKLQDLAADFYKLNDKGKYKDIYKNILDRSLEVNDTINVAKAYRILGGYYLGNGQNDSSYYYYIKAEPLAAQLKDNASLGVIYLDIAFIKLYESDFTGSEISASKALTHLPKDGNKYNIYDAYNIVGVCSNELKNYEKALEYHNKAYEHAMGNNLKSKYHLGASSLNNIGYVYQNMNKDKEAIVYFNKALANKALYVDNPNLYAMLLDNLAYSKFKLKDYRQLAKLYKRSLAIRDSLQTDPSGIVLSKIHLSQLYDHLNDDKRAISVAEDALEYSKKRGAPLDVLSALKQISYVDKQNSATYSQEYIRINDSVQQLERHAKDKFARIAYETAEISSEKEKLEEQNRNLLYIFIGTLTIGMLLFVIRTQRAKNRELMLKQAQQKANEDIYNLMISQQNIIEESRSREKKRIAQELHDGVLGRLFGARLNLDSLNKQIGEAAIEKRNNYLTELKNIEQDIREISHDLNREKYVLINNFVAILNNLLEEQQSSFKSELIITLDDSIKWEQVENTAKINLYRIVQESLQNINKYANATEIKIDLKGVGENIRLLIADNGEGFTVNTKKKGIGLQNMISRTYELKGTFDIRSKKGKGTTISVSFPTEIK